MRKSNYLWLLLVAVLLLPAQEMAAKKKKEKEVTDRELWAGVLYQMAAPVLSNMSEGKLQENMQVELSPTWDGRDKRVTYMECFGRWSMPLMLLKASCEDTMLCGCLWIV